MCLQRSVSSWNLFLGAWNLVPGTCFFYLLTFTYFYDIIHVVLGINNLISSRFSPLIDSRIGLCANISSCDSHLRPTLTIFSQVKRIKLKVVFTPEHGLYEALQDQIKAYDYYDKQKKIIIYSLYGQSPIPAADILKNIDILVIDLQDIGTRYYTFVWSAILIIEQMAELKKKIFILDRPNPLNGETVQGPVLEPKFISFVGLYPVPIRHGMTIGELCNLINKELKIGAEIEVIKMKGWSRQYYYPDTGLCWTYPSPNMPSFETAIVYPGMCLLEGTNVSEGRGTTKPFEIFGAPWIDPSTFVETINKKKLPGLNFRPTYFIPTFNKFKNKLCGGAQIYITSKKRFDPVSMGLEIIKTIKNLYPDKFKWRKPPYEFEKHKLPFDILIGNSWIREAIEKNKSITSIKKTWQRDLNKFKKIRKNYLLY